MKLGWLLAIFAAVLLHALIILFGGLLFMGGKENHGTIQEVQLLGESAEAKEKEKSKDTPVEKKEEIETETEQAPDAAEIIRNMEISAAAEAPALEAASLSAIEAALGGQAGAGDFAEALSFASGGRIGGMGKAGAADDKLEKAFSLAEIDQKPRAVFQGSPLYPAELRGKKLEGVVTVTFVVDATGKVSNPHAQKSSHAAFEKPALDAVKQWKFEPAIKSGQRVGCKMRVDIRFPPS
jgi:protein TonB